MVAVRASDARVCLARRANSPTAKEDNGSPPSLIERRRYSLRLLLVVAARVWRACLARYDRFALIEQRDFFAAVPPQNRLLEAGLYLSMNDVAHIRIASLYH